MFATKCIDVIVSCGRCMGYLFLPTLVMWVMVLDELS